MIHENIQFIFTTPQKKTGWRQEEPEIGLNDYAAMLQFFFVSVSQ